MGNRDLFQNPQAASQGQDLYRYQRECLADSDLDSLDCLVAAEILASPLEIRLVDVKSGDHATLEPLYVSGFSEMAPRSVWSTASATLDSTEIARFWTAGCGLNKKWGTW